MGSVGAGGQQTPPNADGTAVNAEDSTQTSGTQEGRYLLGPFDNYLSQRGFDSAQTQLVYFFVACIFTNLVLIIVAWRHYGDKINKIFNNQLSDKGKKEKVKEELHED